MNALDERQKIIKEIIKPAFKKASFKTSGNHFVKVEDSFTKVFSIDNISWNTKSYVSFTLRIGILFPLAQKLMDRPIEAFPSAASCHFQIVSNQINKSDRLFDIKPDTDIKEFRQYTSDVINSYVIPFFERHTKIEDCLDLFTSYTSNRCDIRPFIGLILLEKGNIELGKKLTENITPAYIESFRKKLLDHRDYLILKHTSLNT
jgi:hypothetical protein